MVERFWKQAFSKLMEPKLILDEKLKDLLNFKKEMLTDRLRVGELKFKQSNYNSGTSKRSLVIKRRGRIGCGLGSTQNSKLLGADTTVR